MKNDRIVKVENEKVEDLLEKEDDEKQVVKKSEGEERHEN